MGNNTYTTAGNFTWTPPWPALTQIDVELWAGGGGGGGANNTLSGSAGAGGAYAKLLAYNVSFGSNYNLTVGNGGANGAANANGTNGTNSVFRHANNANAAWAAFGARGIRAGNAANSLGGTTANSSGNVKYAGANGANRNASNARQPGSGGGGAGSTGDGVAGTNGVNAAGGAGGPNGGGNGGGANVGAAGGPGIQPGGGGAGGSNSNFAGGPGGVGKIIISWNDNMTVPTIADNGIGNEILADLTNVFSFQDIGNGIDIYSLPWAVRFFDSNNIAAGGNTNTTVQLTAPSNKTSNNFDPGKIGDDTNPLPSIDIGSNNYTEVEFCIQVDNNYVINNDVIQFRITANGNNFNTYSVTPQWTIGASNNKNMTISDTWLGIDGTNPAQTSFGLIDNFSGNDVFPAPSATLPMMTDLGAGTDILSSLFVSLGVPESLAGQDAISALADLLNLSETATGSDIILSILNQFGISDVGTAVDLASAFFLLSLLDSGLGQDQISPIIASLGISEIATGTDQPGAMIITFILGDSGSVAELVSVLTPGFVEIIESATGSDALSPAIAFSTIVDSSTAQESTVITVTLPAIPDSGIGTDQLFEILKMIFLSLSEAGSGSETVSSISVQIPVGELGTGADIVSAIIAAMSLLDLGAGTDVAINLSLLGTFRKLTVEFTGKSPSISLTAKKPSARIVPKKPKIEIS